ncbi:MAG: hydroxymethylglutaryl-CoA synthase [Terriglobales bacterium]
MAGIVSYGAYVPFYRLSHQEIARAWGKKGGPGEKAVAGPDEDTITMAVEAGYDCLKDLKTAEIDAIYFASTRPPYAQKQSASIIAAALNLKKNIISIDFGHSLRAATNALVAAQHAVEAGSVRKALVIVADAPLPPPDSAKEMDCGDGAAALVIGKSDMAVTLDGSYHVASEFLDSWRLPTERYCQEWEDRFIRDEGYLRLLPAVVSGLLRQHNLGPKDFSRIVYNAIDSYSHKIAAARMGFDYKAQVQDHLYNCIGNTGAASALMILVSALEQAAAGEKILLANYGDGGDAFVLTVTEHIEGVRNRRGVKGYANSKATLGSYGKYLRFRNMMEWEVDRRPSPRTSVTHYYRESEQLFGLIGQRCLSCGHEQFPRQRLCMWCQSRMEKPGQYEDVCLKDQKGVLFTFSMDERAPVADLPNVLCVVDLEGGARYYGLMTDRDPARIQIGQEMEFTFRKINDAQGVHNYFWKVRPVRS